MATKRPYTTQELKQIINEGMWDTLKFKLSKLGSLEKHGKLRGKEDEVAARKDMFARTLEKLATNSVQDLIAAIEEEDAKYQQEGGEGTYPNQKDHTRFLEATTDIAILYDSLAQGIKLYKPGETKQPEGALSPEIANEIVDALRQYVKMLLDQDLTDVYKHFTEQQDALVNDTLRLLDKTDELNEIFGLSQKEQDKKWADKAAEIEREDELAAMSPEEREAHKRKEWGKEESETMKGLKSRLAPVLLHLAGGLSWGAQYALLSLFNNPSSGEVLEQFKTVAEEGGSEEEFQELVDNLGSGAGGFVDVEGAMNGGFLVALKNMGGGSWDAVTENIDSIAEKTGQTVPEVIENLSSFSTDYPPELAEEAMTQLYEFDQAGGRVAGAISTSTRHTSRAFFDFVAANDGSPELQTALGKVGAMSGHPNAPATLLGVKNGTAFFGAMTEGLGEVMKQGFVALKIYHVGSKGAEWAATAGTGAALAGSGILGTLGLGLMGAGLAVQALRAKGRKSSRAQVLDDLWKTLEDFEVTDPVLAPPDEDPKPDEPKPDEPPIDIDPDPETPPPPAPPEDKKRMGLARMDDDGTKIYVATRRNKDLRDKERQVMKKAEDEAVVGRNTRPSTDDLDSEFRKAKRAVNPEKASYDQLVKKIKGDSRFEPEPYFTVDASVYNDLRRALGKKSGIQKRALKKFLQDLLTSFTQGKGKANKRDIVDSARRSNGEGWLSSDQVEAIMPVLPSYGLVMADPKFGHGRGSAKKKAADKGTAAPAALQEAMLRRWKAMAGIKD